jgi:hypothetical protein
LVAHQTVRAGYLNLAAILAIVAKILKDRMRRAFLLVAMVLVAAPLRAAEKLPPVQPRLVARIDGLIATAAKGIVVIQARGAVSSGGWRAAKLRPLKSSPGDAHTIVVEFVAVPPSPNQAVIEGLLPIAANATLPIRRGIFSVRAVSGSNEITTQILK